MRNKKRKPQRSLTDAERREVNEYFVSNSGYFYYVALLFLSNAEDAEDVIQESFLHAMQHIDTFLPLNIQRKNVYIARSIYNLCVDAYRHKNALETLPLSNNLLEEVPSKAGVIPGSEIHLTLLDLGAHLPEKEWFVLQQLYLEGASKAKVARTLECSTDSIRSIASRARLSARKILSAQDKEDERNG